MSAPSARSTIRILPGRVPQTEVMVDPVTFSPVPDFGSFNHKLRVELYAVIDAASEALNAVDHAESLAENGSPDMADAAQQRVHRWREKLVRSVNSANDGLIVVEGNLQLTAVRYDTHS